MSGIDIYPEYELNAETLAAFAEGREILVETLESIPQGIVRYGSHLCSLCNGR